MESIDLLEPKRPAGQARIHYWVADSFTEIDVGELLGANRSVADSLLALHTCRNQLRTALGYVQIVFAQPGAEQVWSQILDLQTNVQRLVVTVETLLEQLGLLLQWRERAVQIYAAAEDSASGYAAACGQATMSLCGGENWIRATSRSPLLLLVPGLSRLFIGADFVQSLIRYLPTMMGKRAGSGSDSLEAQMQISAISGRTVALFTGGVPFVFSDADKTKMVAAGAAAVLAVGGKAAGKSPGTVFMRTAEEGQTRYLYADDKGHRWTVAPPVVGASAAASATGVASTTAWTGFRLVDHKRGSAKPRAVRQVPTPRRADQVLEQLKGPTSQGEVEILKHQNGQTTSWSVLIRGTKEWMPVTGNPHDLLTNLQEVGGQTSDLQRTVLAAMESVGVAPGDAVELVGHSQGGIVAANLAADPRIADTYAVSSVLTAGSPTGGVPSAPGVKALNLENLADIVPALDGRANQVTPGSATVYFDEGLGLPGQERTLPRPGVSPHLLDSYVAAALALENQTAGGLSPHSVNQWLVARRESLGLSDATVTTAHHFQTERG